MSCQQAVKVVYDMWLLTSFIAPLILSTWTDRHLCVHYKCM